MYRFIAFNDITGYRELFETEGEARDWCNEEISAYSDMDEGWSDLDELDNGAIGYAEIKMESTAEITDTRAEAEARGEHWDYPGHDNIVDVVLSRPGSLGG